MAYMGKALNPKKLPLPGFRYYERVGISIVEEHGRVGKYVICICGRELTDEFYGFYKVQKLSIFVIDSYLKDSTFTAVKRECS